MQKAVSSPEHQQRQIAKNLQQLLQMHKRLSQNPKSKKAPEWAEGIAHLQSAVQRKVLAKPRSTTQVLIAAAMTSSCSSDKLRLSNALSKNIANHVITINEGQGGALSAVLKSKWKHSEVHFKSNTQDLLATVLMARSRFPEATITFELDFFWLQPTYFEKKYGTHWATTAMQILQAGADAVTLPVDAHGEMAAMLAKVNIYDKAVHMFSTMTSKLSLASVGLDAGLAKLERPPCEQHLLRLVPEAPFVTFTTIHHAKTMRQRNVAEDWTPAAHAFLNSCLNEVEKTRTADITVVKLQRKHEAGHVKKHMAGKRYSPFEHDKEHQCKGWARTSYQPRGTIAHYMENGDAKLHVSGQPLLLGGMLNSDLRSLRCIMARGGEVMKTEIKNKRGIGSSRALTNYALGLRDRYTEGVERKAAGSDRWGHYALNPAVTWGRYTSLLHAAQRVGNAACVATMPWAKDILLPRFFKQRAALGTEAGTATFVYENMCIGVDNTAPIHLDPGDIDMTTWVAL